jgi:hypothetical protein
MTINSNHQNSKHDDVPNIMYKSLITILVVMMMMMMRKRRRRIVMIIWNILRMLLTNYDFRIFRRLIYKPTGPVSSNIYRPTINSTGPNLKTTLMTINSNHQNSKHDDVPNIMWTCKNDHQIICLMQ